MSKFNKGDLIYIPSGATIFKWSDDSNTSRAYKDTEQASERVVRQ
jgi:hypothetical protein